MQPMLLAAKLTLGPLLLAQARWLRHTAIRLPEPAGERQGVAGLAGATEPVIAMRVLVVGDSSAAGVGVARQEDALAHPVAAHLAAQAGAPVGWQLVARSGVNTAEAVALVEQADLLPADVIVCALGVNDVTSQRTPRQFIDDYHRLLTLLRERTGASAAVLSGLPPLDVLPAAPQPLRWYLGQCAHRLDQALQQWCTTDPALQHVSLQWARPQDMAADRYHPGQQQYREWSARLAEQVLRLHPPGRPRSSHVPHDAFTPLRHHGPAHRSLADAGSTRHARAETHHETSR
jgi:lysophospholipase L1-like esterase